VLTEENARKVFDLESRIADPTSGRPIMLPIRRHRMATTQDFKEERL
jgi:iron complex transport system ATP-binding protein